MRLSQNELDIIKKIILQNIDDAKIVLFGSRVYDYKRGGDIDICVKSKHKITLAKKIRILTQMELAGIQRKVDLVLQITGARDQPIFDTISEEGIVL